MTYLEGNSLHPERGGARRFARYAFNELVELRGRLGDPARLPDRARDRPSFAVSHYLAAFWARPAHRVIETRSRARRFAYVAVREHPRHLGGTR